MAKILYFLDAPFEKTHNVPQRVEMMVMAGMGEAILTEGNISIIGETSQYRLHSCTVGCGQQLLGLRHVNIKCPHISCRREMFRHHSCQHIIWFFIHFFSSFLVINIYTVTWKRYCPFSSRDSFFSSIGKEPVTL